MHGSKWHTLEGFLSLKEVHVIRVHVIKWKYMLSNGHHTMMNKTLKDKIKDQKCHLLYIVQIWIMSIKVRQASLEYYVQNIEKFQSDDK